MASINFEEEKAITIDLLNEEPIQTEVYDINYIPSYKAAELQRQANEVERMANENQREINEIDRKNNETKRETYYEDFKSKADSGYFKGEKGDKGDVGDTGYTLTNTVRGESVTIEDAVEFKLFNLEIDGKSVQNGTPTPDAPVEIESVGYVNLFNIETITKGYVIGSTGDLSQAEAYCYSDYIKVEPNKDYYLSWVNLSDVEGSEDIMRVAYYDSNKTFISRPTTNTHPTKLTIPSGGCYLRISYMLNANIDIMISTKQQNYIPYGKSGIEVKVTNGTDTNTTVLELNEPLRSLPNGVKDIAYIKNNKLYVDRYIGRIVLDGTQTPVLGATLNTVTRYYFNGVISSKTSTQCLSNYFTWYKTQATNNTFNSVDEQAIHIRDEGKGIGLKINKTIATTVEDFKTWLSNNNVQVDYELATPITEEVGDCVINTYAGVNNIDLETNLETEFSVTYAQDMKSILKDYPSMEEIQAYVDSQLGTINEQLASLTEVE
jgi:hypothetical protein